jgi:hypothetical protein
MRVMKSICLITIILLMVLAAMACTTQSAVPESNGVMVEQPVEIVEETIIEEAPTPVPEVKIEETEKALSETEIKEAETDIAELIDKLNKIIASNDFDTWKENLSDDYISYYSDPEVLSEKSKSPLLVKYKIVLRTLEDYFNFVVVGSRQNIQLDEIKPLDRDRIKAYMFINNKSVIIYELIRINDEWKIGKF